MRESVEFFLFWASGKICKLFIRSCGRVATRPGDQVRESVEF